MSARDDDDAVSHLRVPPHSQEAEQAVLGALLLDNGAWDKVGDVLAEADFFTHRHRIIFAALGKLITACKVADLFTVNQVVRDAGHEDEAGGMPYLNALMASVPSARGIRGYAEIVRDKAVTRALIAASDEVATLAFRGDGTAADRLDHAAGLFADLQQRTVRQMPLDAGTLAVRMLDRLNALHEGGGPTGVPTGIEALDEELNGGLRPGKVIVIAARPSVGKTALALQIGKHVAMNEDRTVLVLSQEMEASECMDRLVANEGGIDYGHLQTGKLGDTEWGRLSEAAEKIGQSRLYIDDQAALTLEQIRGKAVALRREKLFLLVVDYLQLCDFAMERGQTMSSALGKLSAGLKRLAKDLQLCVIVLSQLNRDVEKRAVPEPEMYDLRDSGSIEQDADVVGLLWRVRTLGGRQVVGLKLPKNRQGKPGARIALEFHGWHQRWFQTDADINPSKPPSGDANRKGFEG